MPNHSPAHYGPKEKMLSGRILDLFFEVLSQKEALSEIKPPVIVYIYTPPRQSEISEKNWSTWPSHFRQSMPELAVLVSW